VGLIVPDADVPGMAQALTGAGLDHLRLTRAVTGLTVVHAQPLPDPLR